MKIPATFEADENLLTRVEERFGLGRWMIIPNTLHLETVYVTAALRDEIQKHPRCSVDGEAVAATFQDGKLLLEFD